MKIDVNDLVAGLEDGQKRLLTMGITAHRLGQEAALLGGRSELEDFEPELEQVAANFFEAGSAAFAVLDRALRVSPSTVPVEQVD